MSSQNEKFATAINCMDGRAIRATLEYFERELGILYPDMPTDAGAVKNCGCSELDLESVRSKVADISVNLHGSHHVAIVAHEECAGNPISKEAQIDQIERYVEIVRGWVGGLDSIEVFGLWCERNNEGRWVAERVSESVAVAA